MNSNKNYGKFVEVCKNFFEKKKARLQNEYQKYVNWNCPWPLLIESNSKLKRFLILLQKFLEKINLRIHVQLQMAEVKFR